MSKYDSRVATRQHISEVRRLLGQCLVELSERLTEHDASKLRSPEVEIFDEWTPKLAGSTYGSPEYTAMLAEMKPALDHHYANNRHHPEYHAEGIAGMNLLDLLEMICDWISAAKRHANGNVRRSIEINAKRFGYGEQMERILQRTVDALEGLDQPTPAGKDTE